MPRSFRHSDVAGPLPEAHGIGIDPVLVTCDEDNVASHKVIERGGGIFDNRHGEKLRFWVPTS